MKRILSFFIMITFSLIPIYYIAIWEPKDGESINAINEKSEDYIVKDVNEEETNFIKSEKKSTKPILRMGKEQIEKDMSDENKKKLKNIISQLSTVDLNRIEEISKKDDVNEATKEIINLLRKRLSKKEYKKIEAILVPYINFDVIKKVEN